MNWNGCGRRCRPHDFSYSRLRQQRIALPKLRIWARLHSCRPHDFLDKWIGMAVDDGARDLELTIYQHSRCKFPLPYSLPTQIFASDFIKTLTLRGEGIIFVHSLTTVGMKSLQYLKLDKVTISNKKLQKFLRGCPSLETLVLYRVRSLTRIIISGLIRLERLEICLQSPAPNTVHRIKIIEAPALEIIHFVYYSAYNLSDTYRPITVFKHCPKLKELQLRQNPISQESFQELLRNAPSLEFLKITACLWLESIQVSNPLLQKIEIGACMEALKEIELNTPKLSSLSLYVSAQRRLRMPQIRIGNGCCFSNCKVAIQCPIACYEPQSFLELREFISQAGTFRSLSLNISEMLGDWHNFQSNSLSPCHIDLLQIQVKAPHNAYPRLKAPVNAHPRTYPTLLEGVMSVCRPATLQPLHCKTGFLKFLYKKLNKRDDYTNCCCKGGEKKCWVHELKGVEIEYIKGNSFGLVPLFGLLPSPNNISYRLHW